MSQKAAPQTLMLTLTSFMTLDEHMSIFMMVLMGDDIAQILAFKKSKKKKQQMLIRL